MSYIVPKEIPNRCGRCPCFHAEHPMYCQAVKADKNKRIYAPYGEGRPDWCPLIEVPAPHGRLIDADELKERIRKALGIKSLDNLLPSEKTIVKQIDMVSPIQPESHWISVSYGCHCHNNTER